MEMHLLEFSSFYAYALLQKFRTLLDSEPGTPLSYIDSIICVN